jgi:hypothetical protein
MKQDQADRWAEARANGRWSYVLWKGVFRWGGLMYVLMVGRHIVEDPTRMYFWLGFGVPLWAAGGALFGLLTWHVSERQYRRFLAAQEPATV